MGKQIDSLVRKLRAEGEAVQARLAVWPADAWELTVYAEGQAWKARDILAHLVSAERGHQSLIASVAGGGPGSPPDFDLDRYNHSRVAKLAARSVPDLLAELRQVRADTIALVAGLSDDDLARRGRHPGLGEDAALANFIRIVFMHVKMHLRDLTRALGA
jgi:hypothetical protein